MYSIVSWFRYSQRILNSDDRPQKEAKERKKGKVLPFKPSYFSKN